MRKNSITPYKSRGKQRHHRHTRHQNRGKQKSKAHDPPQQPGSSNRRMRPTATATDEQNHPPIGQLKNKNEKKGKKALQSIRFSRSLYSTRQGMVSKPQNERDDNEQEKQNFKPLNARIPETA